MTNTPEAGSSSMSQSPPPLDYISTPLASIEASSSQTPKKRKIRTTTSKTQRFVTLSKMQSDNLQRLDAIEKNTFKMAESLGQISDSIKWLVEHIITSPE